MLLQSMQETMNVFLEPIIVLELLTPQRLLQQPKEMKITGRQSL
jgi:hypothetical protein